MPTKRTSIAAIAVAGPRTAKPTSLEVGANVRKNPNLDQAFLDSITERGILAPIIVEAGLELGTYKVIDGQRRTLAAIQLGLTEVPIHVVDPHDAQTLLVDQLIANDQREQITTADRAKGYRELELFGLTADQIAKKVARPKAEISTALKVADSAAALAAVTEHQITLEHAAAIAEYPEAVEALTRSATDDPTRFHHTLAKVESDRQYAAAAALLATELEEKGIPVVEKKGPEHHSLRDLTGPQGGKLEPTKIIGKGLVAVIISRDSWNVETSRYSTTPDAVYLVADPEQHGFTIVTGKPSAGSLTDEQKAERKQVREHNTAWPLATQVRHEWIKTELLARKSLPSDANVFIATSYAGGHPHDSNGIGLHKAAELLGIKDAYSYNQTLVVTIEKNPTTATRTAVAIAIARAENHIDGKEGWRRPSSSGNDAIKIARYLNALAAWGYGLSEIEGQLVEAGLTAAKGKSA